MTDNRTTEKLLREFVAVACECEVRDYLISEYAERIEQAIAATLGSEPCVIESTRYIESDIPDSWYEFDLSCGHTVKSEQVPPNYCEECGKRIDLQGVSYV